MKHPNAATAGGVSVAALAVVWIAGRLGVSLSAEDGALLAGAASAVALFIGRNGLRGAWNRIVNGSSLR